MAEFAVVISYDVIESDRKVFRQILLDTVDDVSVNASSEMTTHPVVSGDIVADHVIQQPSSLTITGTLSMNGGQAIVIDGTGTKLADVQQMFEKLMKEAILCKIYKISNSNKQIRFLERQNMVLQNITWKERINSVDFTFTFNQAMLATVQTYDVDLDDQYLPNINDPATLNFTDSLLDWNQVDTMVIKALVDFKLITQDFLDYMGSMSIAALVGLGVGLAIAGIVVGAIAVSIPVIGAIIAGVVIVGMAIINGIKNLFKKTKYKIDTFKKYRKDRDNQREVQRFSNFIGEIHTQISKLNDVLKVYKISSNEPQECMVSIGGNYYIFKFTKNNTNNKWSCITTALYDNNETQVSVVNDVNAQALTAIDQCTNQNKLFRAYESGEYVYLMKAPTDESKPSSDLTNYLIFVSSIDMNEFSNTIYEIIKNALTY